MNFVIFKNEFTSVREGSQLDLSWSSKTGRLEIILCFQFCIHEQSQNCWRYPTCVGSVIQSCQVM